MKGGSVDTQAGKNKQFKNKFCDYRRKYLQFFCISNKDIFFAYFEILETSKNRLHSIQKYKGFVTHFNNDSAMIEML